jgi:hypothetical protein
MIWKIALIALPLAGCVTTDDRGLQELLAERASRTDVALAIAEVVCKQQARTLVQIARCELRSR